MGATHRAFHNSGKGPVTFVSALNTYSPSVTQTNSQAANAPTAIVTGNLLLALATIKVASLNTITTPVGWTPLGSDSTNNNTTGNGAWFSKTATGAEPATYTFTATGGDVGFWAISLLQFAHAAVDATTPTWSPQAGGTTYTLPTITASGNNETWVGGVVDVPSGANAAPTGFSTAASDFSATLGSAIGTFYKSVNAGATGTVTGTMASSSGALTTSLLLVPA